jgi:hypothetical protein
VGWLTVGWVMVGCWIVGCWIVGAALAAGAGRGVVVMPPDGDVPVVGVVAAGVVAVEPAGTPSWRGAPGTGSVDNAQLAPAGANSRTASRPAVARGRWRRSVRLLQATMGRRPAALVGWMDRLLQRETVIGDGDFLMMDRRR